MNEEEITKALQGLAAALSDIRDTLREVRDEVAKRWRHQEEMDAAAKEQADIANNAGLGYTGLLNGMWPRRDGDKYDNTPHAPEPQPKGGDLSTP